MKRRTGKRDPNHDSEDDGSVSDDSKRLRRRRKQTYSDNEVNGNLPKIRVNDLVLTAPTNGQGPTTSSHSIENIGENVNLPDYVREHNSTLTFPEKLMLTLTHVDRERSKSGIPESGESIGWVLDGTAFVVQNIDQLCATWLPMFFGQSKFSSFTRKLYRWGFRKINVASIPNGTSYSDNALFFGNEHFLRSDKSQLSLMKSVTAAKTRSGAAGPSSRAALPANESNAVETTPQVVSSGDANRSHPPQNQIAPIAAGEDMVSLLQQSVNLSSLLTLLSANQQGSGAAFNQPPQLINPILADSIHNSSIPSQMAQPAPADMNQMLQQLCVSAALLRASGAIQNQPQVPIPTPMILPSNVPTLPWWTNPTIPTMAPPPNPLLPLAPMLGWQANVNRPVMNLQQSTPQSAAEQERLRGVMDTFVRYCETVQQQQHQQQGAPRPPPSFPPPPPPPH